MKILYIHQYFKTLKQAGSHRSWYIAEALLEAGHEVEIIASGKGSCTQIFPNGLLVHYLAVPYSQSMSFWQRIHAFLLFFWKSFWLMQSKKGVHLVYATSTPLTVGVLSWLYKKIKKTPYIFEVRDLWPLLPIEMGFIKNKSLQKILYFLEKKIYQNAQKIIVLSPPMQVYVQAIAKQIPIICVPNISDCDLFVAKSDTKIRFKVIYAGSIGKANALERLLEVALEATNIDFEIIGEGSEWLRLQTLSQNYLNVHFAGIQTKEAIAQKFAEADAFYISFAKYPSLETCSPNKFFDGLAAGKLCITNTTGWIKELIESEKCGFYAPNPEIFAQHVDKFFNDPKLLHTYQQNARKLAENYFDKKILCGKVVDFISF